MIAEDSPREPDPPQQLAPRTIDALRTALVVQRTLGSGLSDDLAAAVHIAGAEARLRGIAPEAVIVQLKRLVDEVGIVPFDYVDPTRGRSEQVREWMVRSVLRAYWPEAK